MKGDLVVPSYYKQDLKGPYTNHFEAEVVTRGSRNRIEVPRDLYEDMKLEGKGVAQMARDNRKFGLRNNLSARIVTLLRVSFIKGIECYELEFGKIERPTASSLTAWCKQKATETMASSRDLRSDNRMYDFGYHVTKAQMEVFQSGWKLGSGKFVLPDLEDQPNASRRSAASSGSRRPARSSSKILPTGREMTETDMDLLMLDLVKRQLQRYQSPVPGESKLLTFEPFIRGSMNWPNFAFCHMELEDGVYRPALHASDEIPKLPVAFLRKLMDHGYLAELRDNGEHGKSYLFSQKALVEIAPRVGFQIKLKKDRDAEDEGPSP